MEGDHVLVIGAASLDIKGEPASAPVPGTSTPGSIRNSIGGAGRNVAENLARLEVETVLITAVGDDSVGERILGHAAASGIRVNDSIIMEGGRTGSYIALLQRGGGLEFALDDMDIMQAITPAYLLEREHLFATAKMVVIDANLTDDTLQTIVNLCRKHNLPLSADPTSAILARKLVPYLDAFYMLCPNGIEASLMTNHTFDPSDRDEALVAAGKLVSQGVDVALITLSEYGVVYVTDETRGHIPAVTTNIVDPTGADDAQTAAIIFGLIEEIPLDECIRLGVTAATLTLRTRETVRSDLTVDLLYDELVI